MTTPYTQKEFKNLIEDDTLVSLYHNPVMREKAAEFAQTYKYFFDKEITKANVAKPVLAICKDKTSSLFQEVAYSLTQSLWIDYFTNADMKNKKIHKTLIHMIRADHESAADKIEALGDLHNNAVFLTFTGVDKASAEVIEKLNKFLQTPPDNMFVGLDASKDVPALQNVERITWVPEVKAELDTAAKPKMR